jgi:hypothetical protein
MTVVNVIPEDLLQFPAPESTKSYLGISHSYLFDMAQNIGIEAGFDYKSCHIEMREDGKRAFMKLFFEQPNSIYPFFIGVRSTYDKSARVALASGASVMVCSNLCVFGDDMVIVRKHTPNALTDLDNLATRMKLKAKDRYDEVLNFCNDIKDVPVSDEQGRMIIGASLGKGILTHGVYKDAMKHWYAPPFEEFENEKNLWGVYNAMTYGAHKAPVNQKLQVNVAISDFIKKVMDKEKVLL